MMKTPMILPWLARKAGVSDARAEKLWADALRYATVKTGWVGTSEYWRVAVERVVELLERESVQTQSAGFSPAVRFQTRMWMFPLIAWHGFSLIAAATWAKLASQNGRHAH